jgi:hypothetical protein
VKSTASHGYASKNTENEIGKQLLFMASNAYYFFNHESASKEVWKKFLNISVLISLEKQLTKQELGFGTFKITIP